MVKMMIMKRLTQIFQTLLGVVALIATALVALGRLVWRTIRNWWTNRSKWLRRLMVTVAAVGVVGMVGLLAYDVYNDNYGRDYWDRELADGIYLHSYADNKWRVYDNVAEEYTTKKMDWLSDKGEDNSFAVYALQNRRGYINLETGKVMVDALANDYRKAWVFSEGLAAVMVDKKIGFINAENQVVIPFEFDYSADCEMWDFGYVFHNGYCIMTNLEGKLGLIDTAGNWVLEPVYDEIWRPTDSGHRVVIKDGLYGLYDAGLNLVYEVAYDFISDCRNSQGFVLTKDGKMWQEDCAGNVVTPFMYEECELLHYPVDLADEDYGYVYNLSIYAKYVVSGKYGILNRLTGEPITSAVYDDVEMISPEVFEVNLAGVYGEHLLDCSGRVIK